MTVLAQIPATGGAWLEVQAWGPDWIRLIRVGPHGEIVGSIALERALVDTVLSNMPVGVVDSTLPAWGSGVSSAPGPISGGTV